MRAVWLGRVEYGACWQLQRELAALRGAGRIGDVLLLVEHPATITLGRGARPEHVLASSDRLVRLGVAVHAIDRGGDVTYHGPGQIVGYPITDLTNRGRDLHAFLRQIEEALILALCDFGVAARRFAPHTGIWVGDRKIAAIGIKVSRWISTHGFALNVGADVSGFDLIVPCGIREYGVCSLSAALGRSVALSEVLQPIASAFGRVFGAERPPLNPGEEGLCENSRKILEKGLDVAGTLC